MLYLFSHKGSLTNVITRIIIVYGEEIAEVDILLLFRVPC